MNPRLEPLRCDITDARATATVVLHGELDLATVDQARAALQSVLSKQSVTLDLRDLDFIDGAGLRPVLEIDALARRNGFNFFLVRGPRQVQQVFAITGTEDQLTFIDAPAELALPPSQESKTAG